ncbi:MAG: S49 family peptidase, partial [Candidatus Rickettsiella isopodorum]
RTLTIFGENTPKAREKTQTDLEEIHHLFKAFIQANRKQVDMTEVATGAHWLAKDALALNLVDELITSDDYLSLLAGSDKAEIYECQYLTKKSVSEKLSSNIQSALSKLMWFKTTDH